MAVTPAVQAEINRALAAGNKIDAIKRYREATGLGLKDAKDAIEAIAAGRISAHVVAHMPVSEPTVTTLLLAGNKIEAIKRYREATGLGLKEAKEAVDALAAQLSPGPRASADAPGVLAPVVERPRRFGIAGIAVLLVLAAVAAYLLAG